MDKSTRALSVAEDGRAEIDGLRMEVKSRTCAVVLNGSAAGGVTSFGNITAYEGSGVIVAFDGNSVGLNYCGTIVATGGSPLFAVLPSGRGELALSAVRNNARAIVLGAKK